MVLPTAGAAEASTLIARGLTPRHPVVIHPQFTEPEAALRRAGIDVMRHLLRPDVGFVLAPDAVPGEQDSLIGPRMPGVLVVRSLTKTWGLAGVRAGYVVGAIPGSWLVSPANSRRGRCPGLGWRRSRRA